VKGGVPVIETDRVAELPGQIVVPPVRLAVGFEHAASGPYQPWFRRPVPSVSSGFRTQTGAGKTPTPPPYGYGQILAVMLVGVTDSTSAGRGP
jgi:hypothetical protein